MFVHLKSRQRIATALALAAVVMGLSAAHGDTPPSAPSSPISVETTFQAAGADLDLTSGPDAPGDTVTCDLADLVLAQGNYYDGLRLTSDCLSQELKDDRRAHYLGLRGKILLDIKLFEEALADFEEAIALGSENALHFHGRGMSHLALGNAEAAVSDFQKVMSLEPKSPLGATAMGQANYQSGDTTEAKTFLDFALTLDPTLAPALLLRAKTLFETGGYTRAIETLDKVIAEDSEHDEALYLRGRSHLRLGNFETALEDLDAALTLRPDDDEILTDKAVTLIGLRKLRDATKALDLATELRPGNSRAFYIRGKMKMAQGKTEEGREDIRHAVMIDPEADFIDDAMALLRPAGNG